MRSVPRWLLVALVVALATVLVTRDPRATLIVGGTAAGAGWLLP